MQITTSLIHIYQLRHSWGANSAYVASKPSFLFRVWSSYGYCWM